jgi:hypothetical protein
VPSNRHVSPPNCARLVFNDRGSSMRGILLWVLGIPIPVIILLYLFHVI